jgi:AAA domain
MKRSPLIRLLEDAQREQERIEDEGVDTSALPLTIDDWLKRELPPQDYILGNWLTATSRVILNAPTGLGKTNFGLALAAHMAAGQDFLHWRTPRPSRTLFIDGEMSRDLMKARAVDAVRRLGEVHPDGLHILSHEDVPGFQPLNTAAGMMMIVQIIEKIGALDCVVFDNVMSLVGGSMKDEEAWQEVLALITSLTAQNIAQVWIHHTGHDTTKGYGTKTREWQMDTVLHLTAIERPDTDVSFSLSFTKARRRTPDTRRDFEDVSIALVNDEWICSAAVEQQKPPSPSGAKFLLALQNVIAGGETVPFETWRAANMDRWQTECVSMGLLDKDKAHSARTLFAKYRRELIERNHIACHNELVWLRAK